MEMHYFVKKGVTTRKFGGLKANGGGTEYIEPVTSE